MRIAAFSSRCWPDAVRAAGHTCIEIAPHPNAAHFGSTLEDRIDHGKQLLERLGGESVDLIVDAHGDGMVFVDDPREAGMSCLLHHVLGVPLVSHWTETLRILFKGMDRGLLLEALASPTWFKGIFTRAHLVEMAWMGIPSCFYLPLAADDLPQAASTAPPSRSEAKVLFAGSQQSQYFAHGDGVDVRTQWPGAMALAAVRDGSVPTFLEAYRRYGFGADPGPLNSFADRAEAIDHYYACKQFYGAACNLATRDRFVYLLEKRLGSSFMLVGDDRWARFYSLTREPRVDDATYRHLITSTPICLNMVNGDNDTGLNYRHFEITLLGGFLLSYHQPELSELFEVGQECDAFRNETELLDKIEYYLAHDKERRHIAEAGRERTRRNHLLQHRLDTILAELREAGHVP